MRKRPGDQNNSATYSLSNRLRRVWPPVVLVVVALAAWHLISRLSGLPSFILPAPAEVLRAVDESRIALGVAVQETLVSTAIGLAIATALAVLVAFVMDVIPVVRRAVYPLLIASQTVQILAIAPLLIIWFGFGRTPTILVVVLFTFFPMTIASIDGLRATDPDYVSLLQSMGASRVFIFRVVRLPAALPSFFSGLRLSVTYSVVAATIGEWVGGTDGLGLYMLRSKNALKTDQVFVGVVITTLISILLFALVSVAERLAIRWRYRSHRTEWVEKGIY